MADVVEHVFQPRLVAIGAVAELDEDTDDGVGNFRGFSRPDDDVGIFCKIPVTRDAADA